MVIRLVNSVARSTVEASSERAAMPPALPVPARLTLAAPDSRARYCNVSYVLAGLALERTIGESYRSLVTRKVLERAGMTGAGFLDRRDAVPRGRGLGPGRGDLAVEHLAIRRSVRRTAELMHG